MEQPSSTSNGETSFVEVPVVDKATSRDPEADDADTKMASANNSIAEDMSISTLSVELGESETKPSSAGADQQQGGTSVPAATDVDETSALPIDESAADPSSHHSEHKDKGDMSDKKTTSNSEPAKSLPTFPALPSSDAVSDAKRQEPQSSASSPTKSSADDVATSTSTSTSGQQQKLETPPSPSIAITKRPKPGGVASSSKLRAASMPNNPNRGDDRSNSTTTSTAAPAANVTPLRRGKWTKEEEEYAAMVIQMFNAGYLPAPAGT